MKFELFLILLTTSIIITIPLTEFIKRLLVASGTPHRDNVVALVSSMTASTGVGVVYRIPFGLGYANDQFIRLLLLIASTWIFSMVVYDKVVQLLAQHKKYVEDKKGA